MFLQIDPRSSSNLSSDAQQVSSQSLNMCSYTLHICTQIYLYISAYLLKEGGGDQESRMFPDDGKTDVITCSMLTQDFLIFGTEVSTSVVCNMLLMCLAIVNIL